MAAAQTGYRPVALLAACAFFMQGLDGAIMNTSLPQMAESFRVQPVDMSLGITIYMLSTAVFVSLSGWLADRYGTRNIFLLAILVFCLASLACGASESLEQFGLSRAAQGVGGALMGPVGRIAVLRSAGKSDLLHATALITWPALVAPLIGPSLGGYITTYASWRWNFLLNVPLSLLGVALTPLLVPNFRVPERKPLDWVGFALLSTALACLVAGLEAFAQFAWGCYDIPLALAVSGTLAAALASWHLRRSPHPLIDLSPLSLPTYALSTLAAGTLSRVAINATPFLLPLLFQVGFGLSPLESGLLTLAYFAGNLGMKAIAIPLLRQFGFRTVLLANGAAMGLAILAFAFLSKNSPTWALLATLVTAGLTRSMQLSGLNTMAFADVQPAHSASASTLSSMSQQVSMVLGVALAVLALNSSRRLHGGLALAEADFHAAFAAIGLLGVFSSSLFFRLEPNAGAHVTGYRCGR